MSETQSADTCGTSTWTEKEIRQQPASWIRSLKNIERQRSDIDTFLAPLLQTSDLQIVLTGAGTSAFIGDIIAPWLSRHEHRPHRPGATVQRGGHGDRDQSVRLRDHVHRHVHRAAGYPDRLGVAARYRRWTVGRHR